MKPFIILFCLLLHFVSWTQSDTNCIQSRWIALKKNEANKALFSTQQNILETIRTETHQFEMLPFQVECSNLNKHRYFKPSPLLVHDSTFINYADFLDTSYHVLSIYAQSDVPFVDEYGEPLTAKKDDGSTIILYEEPRMYVVDLDEICEIRIKEDRNDNGQFEASEIGFYVLTEYGDPMEELFWVRITGLITQLEPDENLPWLEVLKNRTYQGFQYKQVSCYDPIIRY